VIRGSKESSEGARLRSLTDTDLSTGAKGSVNQAAIPRSLKLGAGVVLTAVAGIVDAVGYIELGGFFASFMSGASISLGVTASGNQWAAAYHAVLLIAVFVIGATIASVVSGILRPWGTPTAILLEAVCLSGAIVMIASGWASSESVVPVVAAMGIQNTAFRPINGVRLGVTFMTGTLVSLSQALGRALIGRSGWWSWAPHALIWCSFVAGAAAGAVLHMRYGFMALVAPTIMAWALGAITMSAAIVTARRHGRSPGAS
jgi:uncharacterized membrane protein YoaK (UPF0700 family)